MDADTTEKLTGTLACDAGGHPLVLHHGTFEDFDRFEKTRDIGFHFGTLAQANARQEDKARQLRGKETGEWRVKKVALAVRKAIVYPDDAGDWSNWPAVAGLARLVDADFLYRMKQAGVTESKVAARHLRDLMVEMGYDAVVYRNMHEGEVGAIAEWSWLVLSNDAIVSLPACQRGEVLDAAVGAAPGLELPSGSRAIPGARNRSGNIRYQSDRREFIHAVGDAIEAAGGTMGPPRYTWSKGDDNSYEIDFGSLKGQLISGIGRVSIDVPKEHVDALSEMVDDFVSYVGLERRMSPKLVYEWQPGETAGSFVERLQREIGRVMDLAGLEAGPDMATPAP